MFRLCMLISVIFTLQGCTQIVHMMTDAPIEPDPNKTTLGTDIDDWQMATAIGVNIKKAHPSLEKANVNVDVFNRVVLLTGTLESEDLRALAGKTANNFLNVRQVHNEILVTTPMSFQAKANDTWIKTKINSLLLVDENIESRHIKVIVENGYVYLMGKVSREQADLAARLASETKGVQKVIRVFEYI